MTASRPVTYKDTSYPSERALARAFAIDLATFRGRRYKLNWSLAESLERPLSERYRLVMQGASVTVLGVTYPSKSAAGIAFGNSRSRVNQRLRAGWSLDDACSLPKGARPANKREHKQRPPAPVEVFNRSYPNAKAALLAHDVRPTPWIYRQLTLGRTLEEIIEKAQAALQAKRQ